MHKLNRAKQRKYFIWYFIEIKKGAIPNQIEFNFFVLSFSILLKDKVGIYQVFFFTYLNVENEWKQYISISHSVKIIISQLIISYSFWRSYLTGIIQHARHLFFLKVTYGVNKQYFSSSAPNFNQVIYTNSTQLFQGQYLGYALSSPNFLFIVLLCNSLRGVFPLKIYFQV